MRNSPWATTGQTIAPNAVIAQMLWATSDTMIATVRTTPARGRRNSSAAASGRAP